MFKIFSLLKFGGKGDPRRAPHAHPRRGLRYIRLQVEDLASRQLGTAKSGSDVVRGVMAVYELAQGLTDEQTRDAPSEAVACQVGCNHCCHLRVDTTPVEVVALASWLNEGRSAERVSDLRRHVGKTDDSTNELTDEARAAAGVACPLLSDGRCSAYEMRPLDCRGFESPNVEICMALSRNPGNLDLLLSRHRYQVLLRARLGLQAASRDLGLEYQTVELTAALRIALDIPDAAERWASGEVLFEGARWNSPPTTAPSPTGGR